MQRIKETWENFHYTIEQIHSTKVVFWGYFSYVVIGWIFLCLPFSQQGTGSTPLDNLFVSTSAVSTTGLSSIDISTCYSFFGQLVVLGLIQLGGIGYMTLGSFIILSRKSPLPSKRHEISKTVFSLPDSFRVEKFIRSVIHFTVVIESLGTLCLYFIFREAGVDQPLWHAVFHSVSSFCTAGFSLYSNSFEQYSTNFWLNVVVAIMSYLGAIGFIVCVDFWRKFRGKTNAITLTSKIILWTTFWMSIIGTTLLFLSEPSTQSQPADTRLLSSFFQCMTAMTTVGFNTLNLAQFSKASLLILIVLMIIGASPSGTGGGLKCTTFSAILGVMRSAIRGEKEVSFWGNPVPLERIWTSVASLGFYLVVLVIGTYLLELTEASTFEENLFEAASALGTVGLSLGITANLTHMGKIVIILLMFCGRLGPLTFGIALFFKDRHISDLQDNDLAV